MQPVAYAAIPVQSGAQAPPPEGRGGGTGRGGGSKEEMRAEGRTRVFYKPNTDSFSGIGLRDHLAGPGVVRVYALRPDGAAAGCGLVVGDVVLSVNGEAVTSWEQASALIKSAQGEVKIVVAPRGPGVTAGDARKRNAPATPASLNPTLQGGKHEMQRKGSLQSAEV